MHLIVLIIHLAKLQLRALAVLVSHCDAFLQDVCGETVDSTLGELFAASFAGMFVTVARVVQLGATLEVLEDQCCCFVSLAVSKLEGSRE